MITNVEYEESKRVGAIFYHPNTSFSDFGPYFMTFKFLSKVNDELKYTDYSYAKASPTPHPDNVFGSKNFHNYSINKSFYHFKRAQKRKIHCSLGF